MRLMHYQFQTINVHILLVPTAFAKKHGYLQLGTSDFYLI